METVRKPLNEDRVALLLGSVIFILALLKFSGIDMLGWAVKIGMWVGDPLDAWRPATKGLLPGYGALFATYAILTGALACCVKLMGNDVVKFVKSFTIIFFIAMICYTLGANAYIAANPTQLKAQGIPWALGLSTEAGLILALVMGIVISNFMPNLAESLKDACRPELFVKIAIVIMGAELGVKAADAAGFAGHIIFRGLCAIVEAYLLYWCVVYYVARRYFKFNRGPRGEVRRRRHRFRRHRRIADPRQGRRSRDQLGTRLDHHGHHHRQDLHRRIHRRVGPGPRMGMVHQV